MLRTSGPSDSEYERSLKRTTLEIVVDMAAWFGKNQSVSPHLFYARCLFGDQCPFPCRNPVLVAEVIHRYSEQFEQLEVDCDLFSRSMYSRVLLPRSS